MFVQGVVMRKIKSGKIALLLILLLSCTIVLAACDGKMPTNEYDKHHNLIEDLSSIVTSSSSDFTDGTDTSKIKFKSDSAIDDMYIDLGQDCTFNTIVMNERGANVLRFNIFAITDSSNGEYIQIYGSDLIEDFKACYIDNPTPIRYLKIQVTEALDKFNITEMCLYNVEKIQADFRTTAYLTVDSIPDDDSNFWGHLEGVTDVIFFSWVQFDKQGNINIIKEHANDRPEDNYSHKLTQLKDAVSAEELSSGREINIFVDVFMPVKHEDGSNINNNYMFEEHMDTAIASVVQLVDDYGFDGVDFDYEYPYSSLDYKTYNKFLVILDEAMPDKLISIATAGWANKYDKATIAVLDQVQVMTYDLFNEQGYHSTFYTTFEQVERLIRAGFKPSQLNTGLPFYSRPVDGSAYWGGYGDVADRLGKYDNLIEENATHISGEINIQMCYYNSYQAVQDKVAHSINKGLGGVMVWHYATDADSSSELSLFTAIREAVESRLA